MLGYSRIALSILLCDKLASACTHLKWEVRLFNLCLFSGCASAALAESACSTDLTFGGDLARVLSFIRLTSSHSASGVSSSGVIGAVCRDETAVGEAGGGSERLVWGSCADLFASLASSTFAFIALGRGILVAVANAVSKSLSTVSREYRAFLDLIGDGMVRKGGLWSISRCVRLRLWSAEGVVPPWSMRRGYILISRMLTLHALLPSGS